MKRIKLVIKKIKNSVKHKISIESSRLKGFSKIKLITKFTKVIKLQSPSYASYN